MPALPGPLPTWTWWVGLLCTSLTAGVLTALTTVVFDLRLGGLAQVLLELPFTIAAGGIVGWYGGRAGQRSRGFDLPYDAIERRVASIQLRRMARRLR